MALRPKLVGVELVLCQCVQEVAGCRGGSAPATSPVKIQGAAAQGAPA